jgi:hypothetical protein
LKRISLRPSLSTTTIFIIINTAHPCSYLYDQLLPDNKPLSSNSLRYFLGMWLFRDCFKLLRYSLVDIFIGKNIFGHFWWQ